MVNRSVLKLAQMAQHWGVVQRLRGAVQACLVVLAPLYPLLLVLRPPQLHWCVMVSPSVLALDPMVPLWDAVKIPKAVVLD